MQIQHYPLHHWLSKTFCSCVVVCFVFFCLNKRQKIYSACFGFFFSTNCDGFCLMAAISSCKSATIISPIVSSSHFQPLHAAKLFFSGNHIPPGERPVDENTPAVWPADNMATNREVRAQTCKSVFVWYCDAVSQDLLAVLHKWDSSTFNLIYRDGQLLMQSLKAPCNSITKRLAPGRSLFRD